MTIVASGFWRTMRSTASMPSICGMVMSMSTMAGLVRLNSAMAVRPSPASPAISTPKSCTILMMFFLAKTESSTTRYRTGWLSFLSTAANCGITISLLIRSLDFRLRVPESRPYLITVAGSRDPFILVVLVVLIGLVVSIVLFGTIKLFLALALGRRPTTKIHDQVLADGVKRHNAIGVALDDCGARHSRNHASVFTLRDGDSAGRLDCAETFRAVFAHAGHQNADGHRAKFLRDRMKQNVHRRTVTVYWSGIAEHRHVSARHAANHHVAIAGTNQRAAGQQQVAGTRFLNFNGAAFIQAARKHFGKTFRHMLHDEQGAGKVRGNLRKDELQGVASAGGNADGDDAVRRKRHTSVFLYRLRQFVENRRADAAASSALGNFNFVNELGGDGFEMSGR